jgi:phage tail-like protein
LKGLEIASLLPEVFQRTVLDGSPLLGLLQAMAALLTPIEDQLDRLDETFDPLRTREEFLPVLAYWVDMHRLLDDSRGLAERAHQFPAGAGRLRLLVAAAAGLAKVRGTKAGLLRFIETASGFTGFAIEDDVRGEEGRPRPFQFRVVAPASARPLEPFIRRLIEREKPAYSTCELAYAGDEQKLNSARDAGPRVLPAGDPSWPGSEERVKSEPERGDAIARP